MINMGTILIIEDELSIQTLLAYDLRQSGLIVEVASDGLEGYKKAVDGDYDVIILDLMLPKLDGINLCEKLRGINQDVHIIMLTARSDENDKIKGLNCGADDYMTKPFSPREVLARVNVGIRRKYQKNDDQVMTLKDLSLDINRHELTIKERLVPLTYKEFELLAFLLKNKGKTMSRDILLETLWGFEYDGDTRIVDVHIFKLRDKLVNSGVTILTKRGIGYMLEEKRNENN